MRDLFYIRQMREDYYLLLIKDTHYCLSTGTLDSVLNMVTSYVKRFKTRDRFLRKIHSLEDRGRVSRKWFEENDKWYRSHVKEWSQYSPAILKAVKEGEKFNESLSPAGRMSKIKPKYKAPVPAETEEVPLRTVKTPKLLIKRKLRTT